MKSVPSTTRKRIIWLTSLAWFGLMLCLAAHFLDRIDHPAVTLFAGLFGIAILLGLNALHPSPMKHITWLTSLSWLGLILCLAIHFFGGINHLALTLLAGLFGLSTLIGVIALVVIGISSLVMRSHPGA